MFKRFLLAAVAVILATPAVAAPQGFRDGFNNLPASHWMSGRDFLEIPYPARWETYFEDFGVYRSGDFSVTETGSGTRVMADANPSSLLITNAAADNDVNTFQVDGNGSTGEVWTVPVGKKFYFEIKFKTSDATQSDLFLGLAVEDGTLVASAPANYLAFTKDDGDALIDFHSVSSSTDTASTGVATLVADTYTTLAFYWNGVSTIQIAVDNVLVATASNVTPPTTEMKVSFAVQNGEAVAKTMNVDYIFVARER